MNRARREAIERIAAAGNGQWEQQGRQLLAEVLRALDAQDELWRRTVTPHTTTSPALSAALIEAGLTEPEA